MVDPALVHEVDLNGQVGTHVIVIGIGQYDHLPGGSGEPTPHHLNLKQLTSPPASARKIASWFIEAYDCPEKPLGSVSLVLSEPAAEIFKNPKTGQSFNVPSGLTEEVRAALKAWLKRAEVDSDSRIILYLSGHGFAEGLDYFYLLRDYGEDPDDPLQGAMNYQRFVTGLAKRKPSNQFLLFDACRSTDPMITLNRTGGQAFFAVDPAGRLGVAQAMQQCPIFSTELDRQAFGMANEASLCARAFIRAMSGACSKKVGNAWYVTTDRIVEALSDLQNRELKNMAQAMKTKASETMKQSADGNSHARIALRKIAGTPAIPVFVRLKNAALAPAFRIRAVRGAHPPWTISDPGSAGWKAQEEWEVQLEVGEYNFEAEPLQAGGVPSAKADTVAPILLEVEL
jgi:hypothetical protein